MYWQNAEGQHVDNPENLEEELTKKLQETGKQPDFVDNCHYRNRNGKMAKRHLPVERTYPQSAKINFVNFLCYWTTREQ